jgi:HlyD family secretion protein
MITRNLFLTMILAAFIVSACKNDKNLSDAYGNFEADETLVSAESNGRLLQFSASEGSVVEKGQLIGIVDTMTIALQLEELVANQMSVAAKMQTIDAQNQVYIQQTENLNIDLKRIENMLSTGASTQKQLDDLKGQLAVIEKQLEANKSQKAAISKDLAVIDAKRSLLEEQLRKCSIINPITGTVLEKYAEPGEITAAGKPLYKVADISTIILRVYVAGHQLEKVKLGAPCSVFIDAGNKTLKEYPGTVSWISQQAEFTPKIIQTRDERVNMVYAVKIMVPNDGSMKIGMPGEAKFDK